ncbi:MAG: hypothetical protein FWD16_03545 [Clostridia bacterium]|nr:hypothetical protein [Clostridia bacterium]
MRKTITILLAAVMLVSATAVSAAADAPKRGDANGDGRVDVEDILAVRDIVFGGGGERDIGQTAYRLVDAGFGERYFFGDRNQYQNGYHVVYTEDKSLCGLVDSNMKNVIDFKDQRIFLANTGIYIMEERPQYQWSWYDYSLYLLGTYDKLYHWEPAIFNNENMAVCDEGLMDIEGNIVIKGPVQDAGGGLYLVDCNRSYDGLRGRTTDAWGDNYGYFADKTGKKLFDNNWGVVKNYDEKRGFYTLMDWRPYDKVLEEPEDPAELEYLE